MAPKLRMCGILSLAVVAATVAAVSFPERLEAAGAFEPCDGEDEGDRRLDPPGKRGHFEALADVSLSTKVEDRLNTVGERFHKKTGKRFVVTSGTRDPESQAVLIYKKLVNGEDLLKLYKDKSAVLEIVRAFESAQDDKKSKSATI